MNLLEMGAGEFTAGLLIFVRTLGIFSAAPIFGHKNIPTTVRICLSFMLCLILLPTIAPISPEILRNVFLLAEAVIREAIVGLVIGFVANMIFLAIQLAGDAVDIQIGFGLANIADPLQGTQSSLVGQFQYIIGTLLFLAMNGHHMILAALVRSFRIVPLNGAVFHPEVAGRILDLLTMFFVVGLQIAAPVMLTVFLTDMALGLLGRTVPQMNLLMVGFPVKILVGMTFLLVSLPIFLPLCQNLFSGMYQDIINIVQAL